MNQSLGLCLSILVEIYSQVVFWLTNFRPPLSSSLFLFFFHLSSTSAQDVKEKMVCQSIIGNNAGKEKIMTVEICANFIQPLLQFSVKELSFTVVKVCSCNYQKENYHFNHRENHFFVYLSNYFHKVMILI